jgi:hypothetical protein
MSRSARSASPARGVRQVKLPAAGRGWAAYLAGRGQSPGARQHGTRPACGHPGTWAPDHARHAGRAGQYTARRDGFTFFTTVTANRAFCDAHILPPRPMPGDLARARTTPVSPWISPDQCHESHDAPCVTGALAGWPRPARSWPAGCRRSWPPRPTWTAASS